MAQQDVRLDGEIASSCRQTNSYVVMSILSVIQAMLIDSVALPLGISGGNPRWRGERESGILGAAHS